jgi:hypothetical protein
MALDSQTVRDGDAGFIGYASRLNPVTLPAGILQASENMRLDRGVAVTRKGAKRMADEINAGQVPLTVPFVLSPSPDAPIVRSSYSGGVFTSAVMRSPDDTNSMEVIILAGGDKAWTYLSDDRIFSSAAWSRGIVGVDEDGNNIAENDLVTNDSDTIIISTLPTVLSYPTNPDEIIEDTDNVEMVQAFDRMYLLREADTTLPGWETQYTNASGITVSTTTATVNVTGHGYTAGMRVRIEGAAKEAFNGHEYDVVTASTDSFTITVPSGVVDTGCNVAGIRVRRVKPPLYWSGDPATGFVRATAGIPDVGITYRRMRSAPWAHYINNRLIVPDGRQNLMLSDILDPDTFDPYWQSFRIGVGGSDRVIAVHPWVDGTFLVFCRKSIWLAEVNQFASTDGGDFSIDTPVSKLTMLTDEIGCSARRSIQTAGNFVYFLSDSGVHRLDAKLDLKLRGDTKPLSDPISDDFDRINATLAYRSVGLYHNNRYYIAVPLRGDSGVNTMFVYSQLNEQWESKDLMGFGVENFTVADSGGERRVFVSNRAGKLMMLDELEEGDQMPNEAANVIEPVPGRIRTRRYGFGNMHNKRFLRSLADVYLPNQASVTVRAATVNPDTLTTLVPGQTNTSGLAEDYTLKNPIRSKAHYVELEFETTANRPEIRNVSVEGTASGLPNTETRHAA